jgi:ribosomal silencing factor RsfS
MRPLLQKAKSQGSSTLSGSTTSLCGCDVSTTKEQLRTLRNETKVSLEQSWKEAEAIRKECHWKLFHIGKLKFQIEESKNRKRAALERLVRLEDTTDGQSQGEAQETTCTVEAKKSSCTVEAKQYIGQSRLGPIKKMISFSKRATGKKGRHRLADLHLKTSSRDLTILAMDQSLRESTGIVRYMREREKLAGKTPEKIENEDELERRTTM